MSIQIFFIVTVAYSINEKYLDCGVQFTRVNLVVDCWGASVLCRLPGLLSQLDALNLAFSL